MVFCFSKMTWMMAIWHRFQRQTSGLSRQRFVFRQRNRIQPEVKVFSAAALGLSGDWSAAFPLSLGRFPPGAQANATSTAASACKRSWCRWSRFIRRGLMTRDKSRWSCLRVPAKITTGQISISLFQDRPAIDKILPRTLRVGVFAKDGTVLSEIKTQTFDSKERRRATARRHAARLSHAADAFNNQEVELQTGRNVPGTNQIVIYKTHSLKLQKPFASDFDEL